jgi:hypothetical protein
MGESLIGSETRNDQDFGRFKKKLGKPAEFSVDGNQFPTT